MDTTLAGASTEPFLPQKTSTLGTSSRRYSAPSSDGLRMSSLQASAPTSSQKQPPPPTYSAIVDASTSTTSTNCSTLNNSTDHLQEAVNTRLHNVQKNINVKNNI